MKINYRNTALGFLKDPYNFNFHTPEAYSVPTSTASELKMMKALQAQFAEEGFGQYFNQKIQYITKPFYEAYINSRSKLKDIVRKTEINDSGTFVFNFEHHTQTVFYKIESNGKGADEWDYNAFICMFTKTPKNDSFGLDILVWLSKDAKEIMDFVWDGFVKEGRGMAWWIADLLLFKTFMKYVEVESKVILDNRKDHHIGVKYVNETDNKVEVLDSTYFTTISRTNGFGVRGHFRFQPCGIGHTDRKLIWIADFEKNGYVKKAKILAEN